MTREPLTRAQRDELRRAYLDGDQSMTCSASDQCPVQMLAAPFDPDTYTWESHTSLHDVGAVRIGDRRDLLLPWYLSPDEARLVAAELLVLADHAEYGSERERRRVEAKGRQYDRHSDLR